jgi:similar to stage IV sporulation protein
MIIKILFNYIIGFVNITVEGFYIERFINNCINNGILLWKVKRKSSTILTANISIKDFKKIHLISRKNKCKININSKNGLPIILHRYRKRKLLALFFIPIILLIIISSRFIWNIEIIGGENINKEELLMQLKEEGIENGKLKSKVDVQNAINSIRLKRDDISWMSVNMKGTNIIVKVAQADKRPTIVNADEYCNIVATKKGIIQKISADTGTILVKPGDIVEKGTILIGGYMEGKYTDTRYVHAKGKVTAKVWYTKSKKSQTTREITQETGKSENRYTININNFKINLYKRLPNFENYDTIKEAKKIKLFSNFYLPIEIEKTQYIEKQKTKITYGKEELKDILIKELEEEFTKEELNKLQITNKVVNIYNLDNNGLELEMTYEILEDITTEEKFEK